MIWPFDNLQPMSADLICADPPWSFKLRSAKGARKSAQSHYSCMSIADIKALPVGHLAAPNCLLFMWATSPMLPQAVEVLQAWGFTYKSMGFWHKRTKHGKTAFGTGYLLRSAGEPFLIGTIGAPKTSRKHRNLIDGTIREHSRKPEEAFRWLEEYMPDARRVELFSRQSRPGWMNWGLEATKFDQEAA